MSQPTIDQTPTDADQAEFDADMAYFQGLVDAIDHLTPESAHDIVAGFDQSIVCHDEADAAILLGADWPHDSAAELLDDWRYGPVQHGAYCPCGSRFEIRGELDSDDYEAIADFDYAHQSCTADLDSDEAEAVAL